MMAHAQALFSTGVIFIILLAVAALYCILFSRNLIRMLIGLELLIKAVTLLIALAGYITGHMALAPIAGSCAIECGQIIRVEVVAPGSKHRNNAREWRAVSEGRQARTGGARPTDERRNVDRRAASIPSPILRPRTSRPRRPRRRLAAARASGPRPSRR